MSRTRLALIATAVLLAMVLAACQSGNAPSGEGEQPTTGSDETGPEGTSGDEGEGSEDDAATDEAPEGNGPTIAAVGDLVCAFGTKTPPIMEKHGREGICDPIPVTRAMHAKPYDAFLPLGDLQYSYGGYWRYLKYWDRYYGDLVKITRPAPGNHEAYADFTGYTKYFGYKRAHMPKRVGEVHYGENPGRITGYYSYNMGGWHMIALNSQLCGNKMWNLRTRWTNPIVGGGCGPNDPMMKWLQRDLAQNADADCTLAYYHHSRFVVRTYKGDGPLNMAPVVELLDENGVDVLLSGHEHDYLRWGPMNAAGEADPEGFMQFVVGTGGDSYQKLPDESEWPDTLQVGHTGTYGVLDVQLNPGGYTYEFITGKGETPFEDSGTGTCH